MNVQTVSTYESIGSNDGQNRNNKLINNLGMMCNNQKAKMMSYDGKGRASVSKLVIERAFGKAPSGLAFYVSTEGYGYDIIMCFRPSDRKGAVNIKLNKDNSFVIEDCLKILGLDPTKPWVCETTCDSKKQAISVNVEEIKISQEVLSSSKTREVDLDLLVMQECMNALGTFERIARGK